MNNAVHHYGTGSLTSVLECFPGEALNHGSDAAGLAIVSCHESSRSLYTVVRIVVFSSVPRYTAIRFL